MKSNEIKLTALWDSFLKGFYEAGNLIFWKHNPVTFKSDGMYRRLKMVALFINGQLVSSFSLKKKDEKSKFLELCQETYKYSVMEDSSPHQWCDDDDEERLALRYYRCSSWLTWDSWHEYEVVLGKNPKSRIRIKKRKDWDKESQCFVLKDVVYHKVKKEDSPI